MNLTDVDDKVISGAAAAGVSLDEFTQPFIDAFIAISRPFTSSVGRRVPAGHAPRAGDDRARRRADGPGHAYARDGSVFFRIAEDDDYGRCQASTSTRCARASGSPTTTTSKEDVRDFVLWKGSQARRAELGVALGPGPARLAHRVLGHEHEVPGRDLRHSLRWRRQHVSPSRERDRPERVGDRRSPSSATGCTPST